MRVNSINNTQMFKGLLCFPKSQIALNPNNISAIETENSFVKRIYPNVSSEHQQMDIFINRYGDIEGKNLTVDEKKQAFHHGNVSLSERGNIIMTNGDKYAYKGQMINLESVYSVKPPPSLEDVLVNKKMSYVVNDAINSKENVVLYNVELSKIERNQNEN